MKISDIKSILIWMCLLFSFSCRQPPTEPIEFSISQGVLTNMDFATIGIQSGQELPDISFYTPEGEAFKLSQKEPVRPKLLISGSYTCDITRKKLNTIDWFYEQYKDKVDIYLINTLEAHPQSSPSPYSMSEAPWLVMDNIEAGIAADQPSTIEERMNLAEKWVIERNIKTPILLDGSKNEFWNQVGQAPNMAILLSSTGEVILKQSWFEELEMKEAIENLLKHLNTE